MVQKYQSPVRTYKYSFELIMAAYERRFPTCPMIPVFVGSDIVKQTDSEDGASQVVERRCKLNVEAPYLLTGLTTVLDNLKQTYSDNEEIFSKLYWYVNSLDRRNRALKIEAYNESFATRVIIHEVCNYFVHPENPNWTCFDQAASLEIKSFYGFENVVEKLAIKQYSANIAKGKEIIEHFIEELKKEGITEIPQWVETNPAAPVTEITTGGEEESTNEEPASRKTSLDNSVKNVESEEVAAAESVEVASSSLKSQHTSLSRQASGGADKGSAGSHSSSHSIIRRESFAEEENKFRLDADYIQRSLGELSPMEESQLIQLRNWLAQLQKGNLPNDTMILRFLRARDFNIEKAREMLSQSLNWRKKYQVDKILSEYESLEVIKDYFPGGWHYNDKDGRPLFILRLGMMDVKGLIKSVGEEGLLKMTLHFCEEGLRLTEDATAQSGHPITTWTLLLDLEGLNMRHLWRPGIRALLRIIEIVEANYPETMGRVLIIRAPRVFPVLWTLVRTFIDERTCSKFFFYAGNDYQEAGGLPDYISDEYLPDFLGGSSTVSFPEGGLVPKSYYMPDEQLEHLALSDESIYKSVSLTKGQVHEVVLTNEDLGSVITWDFDVLRHSVCFSVFRTKNTVVSTLNGTLQPNQSLTENDHKSVIEKQWKEGHDYFRVEASIVCHDGESVQGSHVTNHTGYYILQWKFQDVAPTSHHLMDSITSSKAKVMYYYEVLKSSDYRGSMSSLQSQRSGLSSVSSKANSVIESGSSNSAASVAVSSCPSR